LQTEAVVYITQRTELFVGFFYLSTLYCGIRYWTARAERARLWWLILATIACLAGMASKEVMVSAPVVLLLYERTFISGTFRESIRHSWQLYAGLSLGWVLLFFLNRDGPREISAGFGLEVPAVTWWFTQAKVLLMYLKLVVEPWPLLIEYHTPYLNSFDAAWPWVIAVAGLVAGNALLLRRSNAVGFVGAAVLLILSPTLIVPIITEVAAERRMYLPLAALEALLIVGAYWAVIQLERSLGSKSPSRRKWLSPVAAAVAIVLASILAIASAQQLHAYHTPETLWIDVLRHYPDDPLAHNNLAAILAEHGETETALAHYQRALELKPNFILAACNLGNSLRKMGRIQEALEVARDLVLRCPDSPDAHNNLGAALLDSGDVERAKREFQLSIDLHADNAAAHTNLGKLLFDADQVDEALREFQTAIRLKPDSVVAHYAAATAYRRIGRPEAAISELEAVLRLDPEYAEAQNNLANALAAVGRRAEAIEHYQQAVRLQPDSYVACLNLANALTTAGRAIEAEEMYQRAIALDPKASEPHRRLAAVYAAMNRPQDAIAAAEKALDLARTHGDSAAAKEVESWLRSYRASVNRS
jgi:tetratricopeptide (TPR) repeat protein